jgi:hypothetical protein
LATDDSDGAELVGGVVDVGVVAGTSDEAKLQLVKLTTLNNTQLSPVTNRCDGIFRDETGRDVMCVLPKVTTCRPDRPRGCPKYLKIYNIEGYEEKAEWTPS